MHSHLVKGRGRLVNITNHTKPAVCTHICLGVGVGVGLSVLQIILSLQYMHSHLVRGRGRLVSITNHTKKSLQYALAFG